MCSHFASSKGELHNETEQTPTNVEVPSPNTEETTHTVVETRNFKPKPWKNPSSHTLNLIISDIQKGTQNISQMNNICAFFSFISLRELNTCD